MLLEALLFLGVALLYSSTGHGGGSGYLALLLLLGHTASRAASVALSMNLVVASLALVAFHRAGGARPRLAAPLLVVSVPAAYLGGSWVLPGRIVDLVVGPALLIAGALLVLQPDPEQRSVATFPLLVVGVGLGLLAGVTGIGGGIYLTPLLLIAGWADKDGAAWTSALFILVNSVAGLAARLQTTPFPEASVTTHLVPVLLGGIVGSMLGSTRFSVRGFREAMAAILVLAALRAVVPLGALAG